MGGPDPYFTEQPSGCIASHVCISGWVLAMGNAERKPDSSHGVAGGGVRGRASVGKYGGMPLGIVVRLPRGIVPGNASKCGGVQC